MAGLDDPGVIDLITEGSDGELALIITHDRPWKNSAAEVDQLGEKINNYAAFALDEALVSRYPQASSRPKRIQVDCVDPPPEKIAALLVEAERALREYSVGLTVNLLS